MVKALHQKYGPIVRISPFELSLNDSEFNGESFGKDRKLDKDPWYYGFGFANSLFALLDKPTHRERPAHLASHFSGPYFPQTTPLLTDEVQALCGEFETSVKTSNPLNPSLVYRKAGNGILRTFWPGQHGATTDSEDYAKKMLKRPTILFSRL